MAPATAATTLLLLFVVLLLLFNYLRLYYVHLLGLQVASY